MKNIFKNAYFGKAYRTRDGRKALYLDSFYGLNCEKVVLAIEDFVDDLLYVYPDGWYDPINGIGDRKENAFDIVSEWKEDTEELINTIKQETVEKACDVLYKLLPDNGEIWSVEAFIKSFKRAMEK